MNSLSWFLYLADVVPMLGFAIGQIAIGAAVLGVFGFGFWFVIAADEKDAPKPPLKRFIAVVVIMGIIGALTPSKQTIYLIAGSEAGEYVVTSPEGQEIINDIKAIIKSQIEELK